MLDQRIQQCTNEARARMQKSDKKGRFSRSYEVSGGVLAHWTEVLMLLTGKGWCLLDSPDDCTASLLRDFLNARLPRFVDALALQHTFTALFPPSSMLQCSVPNIFSL